MTYHRAQVEVGDEIGFWRVTAVHEIHVQYGRICTFQCDICGATKTYYRAQMLQSNAKRHSCKRCRRVATRLFDL